MDADTFDPNTANVDEPEAEEAPARRTLIDGAPPEATIATEDARPSQPEKIEGFRARLAAARALAEASAAAKAAAAEAAHPVEAVEASPADSGVEAVSQTMRIEEPAPLPPSAMPEEEASHARVAEVASPSIPAPAERPARRIRLQTITTVAVVIVNIGLGAGLASVRQDEQRVRAPVAAMSSEVKALQSTQTDMAAEIEHTRSRLDENDAALAKTIEKVNATAERQAEAERAFKEHADRETKERAALHARINRVERKVDVEVYTVDDVLEAINVAQGRRSGDPSLKPSKRSGK